MNARKLDCRTTAVAQAYRAFCIPHTCALLRENERLSRQRYTPFPMSGRNKFGSVVRDLDPECRARFSFFRFLTVRVTTRFDGDLVFRFFDDACDTGLACCVAFRFTGFSAPSVAFRRRLPSRARRLSRHSARDGRSRRAASDVSRHLTLNGDYDSDARGF